MKYQSVIDSDRVFQLFIFMADAHDGLVITWNAIKIWGGGENVINNGTWRTGTLTFLHYCISG